MALKDPEPEPIPSGGAAGGTAFPHDWDDDVNVLMKDPTQGEPIPSGNAAGGCYLWEDT